MAINIDGVKMNPSLLMMRKWVLAGIEHLAVLIINIQVVAAEQHH